MLVNQDNRSSLILQSQGDSRKSTDVVCTVIGAAFALTMFIAACVMWDKHQFQRRFSYFYGANDGGRCESGSLYFQNPDDGNTVQCVKSCPYGYSDQSGLCLPNSQNQRQKYQQNPQIATLLFTKQFRWVLLYTSIIALGFGFLRLVYVNIMPRTSVHIDFYLSILLLIGVGVLLLVLYDRYWHSVTGFKITVAVICFILALIVAHMICMYANEIKIHSIFLEYAVLYLNHHPSVYLYIPIFLILSLGLIALIVWQHCCFTSKIGSNNDFFNLNNSGVWGIFNILEFIWGIQFLRDAFHFCVSGNATQWYWKRDSFSNCYNPYRRLVCYHWGSVVAGSFFNAFFLIPTMITDIFRCYPNTFCSKAGKTCSNRCFCYKYLFDLVRTDVYPYINFTGLSYCEAAKQCRRICQKTDMFVGVHSPMKNYRFTSHAFCLTGLFIMSWFIQRYRMLYYGLWNYALIMVVVYLIITWFISIYADVAQALQTCFIAEREMQPNYELMQGLHPEYKDDLEYVQKRMRKDGNC